jgi:lysophospholipase L1-like esterase
MKRAIPWVVAVVALVAFGVTFSELQRMRARFGEVTRRQFYDHQDVRQFMIRAALADLDQPIVVVGDSITEMSRLPEVIDGKPVVNAGIGGTTISDYQLLAPHLLAGSKPSLIVVALGTNIGSDAVQADYTALLSELKKLAPRLLAIGVTRLDGSGWINAQIKAAADSEGVPFVEMPLPEGATLADRIHLNEAGYRTWTPALVAAIAATLVR